MHPKAAQPLDARTGLWGALELLATFLPSVNKNILSWPTIECQKRRPYWYDNAQLPISCVSIRLRLRNSLCK